MADKCWSVGLTDMEVAEQLMPTLVSMIDGYDDGCDSSTLDMIQIFIDRLDEKRDRYLLRTLSVYAIDFWNYEIMTLTEPHQRLIQAVLQVWIDDNDPDVT